MSSVGTTVLSLWTNLDYSDMIKLSPKYNFDEYILKAKKIKGTEPVIDEHFNHIISYLL